MHILCLTYHISHVKFYMFYIISQTMGSIIYMYIHIRKSIDLFGNKLETPIV